MASLGFGGFGITNHNMGSLRVPGNRSVPNPAHPYNEKLGPYLAGLIEGDGTIYVPKNFASGHINHCTISIPFGGIPFFPKI